MHTKGRIMKTDCLLGIDLGTSGVKAIIADVNGRVLARAAREYPLYTVQPGWAEQYAEDWWRAVIEVLHELLAHVDASRLIGVSFSGQMSGLVALDGDMNVIRPVMPWCDQRSYAQCEKLTAAVGGPEKYAGYTNNRLLTGNTGGKLIWLKENEPESFGRMARFICPKDHIRYKLCGVADMDASEASGTGFFDTKKRAWSRELIEIAGLDISVFPEVHESVELAGHVTYAAAAETGLPEGLPVYYGGGDTVVQAAGSGLISPGTLGIVLGTSGNVAMGLNGYRVNPGGRLQIYCGGEPDRYVAFGCTLTAGGAYKWYRDVLCGHAAMKAERTGRSVYDIMEDEARRSPPGANGVVFAPYLAGERCPYPDPDARAVFYGMTLGSTRSDMTRAVMEGIAFSMKQAADMMEGFAERDRLCITGGGAASPLWRQIFADVFGMPVITMSAAAEGGAYGAMMIAGVGAGVWNGLEGAMGLLSLETETLPDERDRKAYGKAFAVYSEIYPALSKIYEKSANRQREDKT